MRTVYIFEFELDQEVYSEINEKTITAYEWHEG